MAEEVLARAGLYLDELNKIRVVDPKAAQLSANLKDESTSFIEKTQSFDKVVQEFISSIDQLAKLVEQEKMKAIGSRNLLKSVEKQKEAEKQQIQALILEKQVEIERLRLEHEALQKEEAEQREYLQRFLLDK